MTAERRKSAGGRLGWLLAAGLLLLAGCEGAANPLGSDEDARIDVPDRGQLEPGNPTG
jgi:hypothetical protein